ncbi:unnamed protein product [Heligmosomoides polygyrus]|uniref:DUF4780 domain-containing protein n=1 Tax=Heligmosomoides polygyrus TaxID=6339 RepID=A0A183G1U1_HELPZ|nr:unnamed protein product [Heligmosomoides polygyrus]
MEVKDTTKENATPEEVSRKTLENEEKEKAKVLPRGLSEVITETIEQRGIESVSELKQFETRYELGWEEKTRGARYALSGQSLSAQQEPSLKHEAVEDNCVLDFYQKAFEQVKEDLKKEARTARKPKEGPTGFAAPETAQLMEKDGPRCGLITKLVLSCEALKDVLKDWKTFGTWTIVYPIEAKGRKDVISEILKPIKLHLQAGGRIITAWTPITAQEEEKWLSIKLWRTLDDMILKFGGNEQVVVTASNIVKDGKLLVEVLRQAVAMFDPPRGAIGNCPPLRAEPNTDTRV